MSAEAQRRYVERHPERVRASRAKYAEAHSDQIRERHARYMASEAGRQSHYRTRLTQPLDRTAAHNAINKAVRSGRLVRLPCEVCAALRAEAHHYMGYDPEHRLTIRWLCRSHHRQAHEAER